LAGSKKRSGGARNGAGRRSPRGAGGERAPKSALAPFLPAIRAAAEAGSEENEIVRALRIPDSVLADPAVLTEFRGELAAAHARYAVELRQEIRRRGKRSTKNAGSVNALALQARNVLDWDRELPNQETEPDLGTARQRLRDLFVQLARARSEVEGRTVTVLELLYREAQADRRDGDGDAGGAGDGASGGA
jgi:hypothetical protein